MTAAGRATPVRILCWCMMTILAVFLINNALTHVGGWPGARAFTGDGGALAWLQAASYPLAIVLGVMLALRRADRPLRAESETISDMNTFLIRAAFWAVFLVGIVDAAISFLRVEELLPNLVGEDLTKDLSRAKYRGTYVHLPLIALGVFLAMVTRTLGFTWLALLIVVAELSIVLTRFVFSYEQAFMGDLVRFWYAALFLFASAYTLLEEGHVRVDVFYAGFRSRTKGWVNSVGAILMGLSVCWCIILIGMGGKSAIVNGPLLNFEVTQSGFGMFVKYLMAGFLGIFAISMTIQFTSYLLAAVADIRDEPGKREPEAPSAH